jgi:hypothetical protein
MKEWVGRLIGYVFLGSFCIAGPLLLIFALGVAVQRAALVISGLHANATIIGALHSGSTRVTYAPVFRFTAGNGHTYTVNSDVYGKESEVRFGEHIQVIYSPRRPESARIDRFAPLWTLPLVAGGVGAGFSVVPAIMLVAWMRRRAGEVEPAKREAALIAADTVSRGFRRALGVLLITVGAVLLASGVGMISTESSVNGSRLFATTVGVLLVASGMQVGQWVAAGGRLSDLFGSVVATSMAAMFGWVAINGDAANFHGTVSVGGAAAGSGGSATFARILFAAVSLLTAAVASWAWKRVLRPRPQTR